MIEPTTVGLTNDSHDKLRRLKEDGHFAEMTDGYRFAIALALAHGAVPASAGQRTTIVNVGTLDPDKQIYTVIRALCEPLDEPIYSIAERLAEWGVIELARMAETGTLSFARILEEAGALQNKLD